MLHNFDQTGINDRSLEFRAHYIQRPPLPQLAGGLWHCILKCIPNVCERENSLIVETNTMDMESSVGRNVSKYKPKYKQQRTFKYGHLEFGTCLLECHLLSKNVSWGPTPSEYSYSPATPPIKATSVPQYSHIYMQKN